MALTDSLISHWKLNESSGTRVDSHGSNDLTDNNTVGVGTGKLGNGADFETSNSEYLSHASNSDLQTGDVDFTWAAWVKLESLVNNRYFIIGKDSSVSGGREYTLYYDHNNDQRFEAEVFRPTDSGVVVGASNHGAASTGTWYFVVFWHDSVANEIGIQINNGTPNTVSTGGSLQAAGSTQFRIGARVYSGIEDYFDGLIDSVSFWKRVLTSQERTDLYNSGNGLDYDDWDAGSSVSPAILKRSKRSIIHKYQ